jgi:hypothetical protein
MWYYRQLVYTRYFVATITTMYKVNLRKIYQIYILIIILQIIIKPFYLLRFFRTKVGVNLGSFATVMSINSRI